MSKQNAEENISCRWDTVDIAQREIPRLNTVYAISDNQMNEDQ
jgi:hypothetical protein